MEEVYRWLYDNLEVFGDDQKQDSAIIIIKQGLADHIDLNMGCPVPKVTKKGGGAALPWKQDLFKISLCSVCLIDS